MAKRDGEWRTLEVRELVPGDVIELKGGDVIPADAVVRRPSRPFTDASALSRKCLCMVPDVFLAMALRFLTAPWEQRAIAFQLMLPSAILSG